ncbi:metal-dependent hydrolase [Nocardia sp. NPDC059239]|uniref:metal-dependent hydrolase n=1 Tax=unclassified Nocardia TaxID=2637762 RepID=UPI0036B5AFD2
MTNGTLTWLGHNAYRIETPGGKTIYIDPWLSSPTCPEGERHPEKADLIALTHGHFDHVGETVELYERFGCPVIAAWELRFWLATQGLEVNVGESLNRGGSTTIDGVTISLTDARHSSSAPDGTALGEACGIVVELEDGVRVYFAGDTCAFLDMQLIARIHAPDLAVLPIGGHVTMGPLEAGIAVELLGVSRVVPTHYGTEPFLAGTVAEFRQHVPEGVEVIELTPGAWVDLVARTQPLEFPTANT